MQGLVHNLSNPGQLVLNPFADVLWTTKEFLLVENTCTCVGCEKDVQCFEKSMPWLVKAFSFQLFSQASALSVQEDLMEVARVFLDVVHGTMLRVF